MKTKELVKGYRAKLALLWEDYQAKKALLPMKDYEAELDLIEQDYLAERELLWKKYLLAKP